MRDLGIFCAIGGGPADIIEAIVENDKFSDDFNLLFNDKYNYRSYGTSLEYIMFGTTYISANSKTKEEIMFSLGGKDFIYSTVLTKRELVESSYEQLTDILVRSIETGIGYMKGLDVGDFDVLKMERDIAKVLLEMGYNYNGKSPKDSSGLILSEEE